MERDRTSPFFLRVTSSSSPPFTQTTEISPGIYEVSGPYAKIYHELVKKLNISYVIKPPESGGYGTMLPNRTATGMAGMVFRKEIDLIIANYALSYGRYQAVDYLMIISTEPATLMSVAHESKQSVDFTNTVMKINLKIWLLYLISVGISCLWYVVDDTFRKYRRRKKMIKENSGIISYFWGFICIFIFQGSSQFESQSSTIPKRILFMCFSLSVFFFNMYFGGDMSTDAVLDTRNNIDSMQELIDDTKSCFLTAKGSILDFLFRSGKGGIYERIHKRIQSCPMTFSPGRELVTDQANKMILSGKYSLFLGVYTLYNLGNRICKKHPGAKLHIAREPFSFSLQSIGIGRHVDPSLKKTIIDIVGRIIGSDLMQKWLSDAQGIPSPCFQPEPMDNESGLTLGDLESLKKLFYVWMAGIALSVVALAMEVLFYFVTGKRRRRRNISRLRVKLRRGKRFWEAAIRVK